MAYLDQVDQGQYRHQSTDIVRSSDWDSGRVPPQHMSTNNINQLATGIKAVEEKFAQIDQLLLSRVGQDMRKFS